jgi:cation diffusion facilitator family transporter
MVKSGRRLELDHCPLERWRGAPGGAELRARAAAVRRVFWITLVLNLAVAAAKGIYGYLSGSVTLRADSFHSVLDAASNVLALVGMRLSAAPADVGHPYGHRKFETIAAIGIGISITLTLVEIGREAWDALSGSRPPPDIGLAGFLVVTGTLAVNAGVSHYERKAGERLASSLLVADAHHTRSDMYASATVLLSFFAARAGFHWADGVGALLVGVMVGRVALQVFRENLPFLVDAAVVDPARIQGLSGDVSGVVGVHQVRSRGTRWAIELDLHLEVDPLMTVERAHAVAHAVEDRLRAALPYLADVVVHVEPCSSPHPGHPRKDAGET